MTMRRISAAFAVLLTVAYLAYLVAIPLGLVTRRLEVHEVALAAGLLAGVYFAAAQYSITDVTIGAGGVTARLDRAEAKQRVLESDLRAIQVALGGLVTKYEWGHLRGLAAEGPMIARSREDRKLQQELERLDAMGFVEPLDPRGLNAIWDDHGHTGRDFDLKPYVAITDAGREYLRLRESL
ncbi:hypothetical protein SAMN05444920_106203 [Nonomuraea solani]|uniref:Uncharacterized protein n=1 Tax=Nonomuraea solani TaxID=1144553 RepID=A0A1H6DSC4_9ACTN|nr:hypothetical protein [Nonomuraea solani]SEG88211.1 hypothetical protein SAMN05444920_106203 [Nonomuraea solani]